MELNAGAPCSPPSTPGYLFVVQSIASSRRDSPKDNWRSRSRCRCLNNDLVSFGLALALISNVRRAGHSRKLPRQLLCVMDITRCGTTDHKSI